MQAHGESASRAHHRWILGRYVQLIAVLQLVVYGTAGVAQHPQPILSAIDPRLLISFLNEALGSGPGRFPSALAVTSAFAAVALGEAVVQSRRGLAVYAIVEAVYAMLFLAFSALVVAANLSPSHGFGPRELVAPFAVFTAASALPLLVALPLWRAPD